MALTLMVELGFIRMIVKLNGSLSSSIRSLSAANFLVGFFCLPSRCFAFVAS